MYRRGDTTQPQSNWDRICIVGSLIIIYTIGGQLSRINVQRYTYACSSSGKWASIANVRLSCALMLVVRVKIAQRSSNYCRLIAWAQFSIDRPPSDAARWRKTNLPVTEKSRDAACDLEMGVYERIVTMCEFCMVSNIIATLLVKDWKTWQFQASSKGLSPSKLTA